MHLHSPSLRALGRSAAVLAAVSLAACSADQAVAVRQPADAARQSAAPDAQSAPSFAFTFERNAIPADFAARIEAAGGTVTSIIPQLGVAFAASADPTFAARAGAIGGVSAMLRDQMVQWVQPTTVVEQDLGGGAAALAPQATPINVAAETFWASQWAPRSIQAPEAWAAGARGAGARVAIIDGGFRNTHLDLAPGIEVATSKSFVPGQPYNADVGTFWHGTHVMGITGARANGIGTIGIAPEATLIGVKALHNGSGSFEWIINAIVYAATPLAEGGAGADIINLSLGAGFQRQGSAAASLASLLGRATMYARQQGVTVIAASGNDGQDLDHTANLVFVPAQSPGVIAISSTAPEGFARTPSATNFTKPASYTNFGRSAVGFAAPGGDFDLPGTATCSVPRLPSGFVTFQCYVHDMVVAPSRGSGATNSSYSWAAGTSMASPAAAGVAALIVGKYGRIGPAQVEARLRRSATQPGRPGNDPYYGAGYVNALRAVQ